MYFFVKGRCWRDDVCGSQLGCKCLREFVSNHVVWAPFVILRTMEGMVAVDIICFVALTFAFKRKDWKS